MFFLNASHSFDISFFSLSIERCSDDCIVCMLINEYVFARIDAIDLKKMDSAKNIDSDSTEKVTLFL